MGYLTNHFVFFCFHIPLTIMLHLVSCLSVLTDLYYFTCNNVLVQSFDLKRQTISVNYALPA